MDTLLIEYPFLKMSDDGQLIWLDAFESGWQRAFGIDFCEELKEALIRDDKLDEFEFVDIKEKYGMLDISAKGTGYYSSKVIDKYENISQFYCAHCGKPARYVYTNYIYPVCEECVRSFDGGTFKTIEYFHGFDDYFGVKNELARLKNLDWTNYYRYGE